MNNIDYAVISSDDNPTYKDFYPIIAKQWLKFGIKTYYINITDNDSIIENEYGIIQNIKALDFVSVQFQSQVVRLFSSTLIEATLLMSDIDMLPINGNYYKQYLGELTDENVIVYSGQPYINVPYYPMCYVLSKAKTFRKYLGIENLSFAEFCNMLKETYTEKWNTDEHFMYEKFQLHQEKILIKNDRNFYTDSKRIDRGNWVYDTNLLSQGHYIDSHLLRPYNIHKDLIDKLINES